MCGTIIWPLKIMEVHLLRNSFNLSVALGLPPESISVVFWVGRILHCIHDAFGRLSEMRVRVLAYMCVFWLTFRKEIKGPYFEGESFWLHVLLVGGLRLGEKALVVLRGSVLPCLSALLTGF